MTLLCSLSILKSTYFTSFLTMWNDQSTSNALYASPHYLPYRKDKNLDLFQHTTTVLQQPTHFTVLEIPLKPDCNLDTEKFLAFKELKWSSPCLQKPVTGILSKQNSVHNLIPCLCKIHFSIIIPSSQYINWARH